MKNLVAVLAALALSAPVVVFAACQGKGESMKDAAQSIPQQEQAAAQS